MQREHHPVDLNWTWMELDNEKLLTKVAQLCSGAKENFFSFLSFLQRCTLFFTLSAKKLFAPSNSSCYLIDCLNDSIKFSWNSFLHTTSDFTTTRDFLSAAARKFSLHNAHFSLLGAERKKNFKFVWESAVDWLWTIDMPSTSACHIQWKGDRSWENMCWWEIRRMSEKFLWD